MAQLVIAEDQSAQFQTSNRRKSEAAVKAVTTTSKKKRGGNIGVKREERDTETQRKGVTETERWGKNHELMSNKELTSLAKENEVFPKSSFKLWQDETMERQLFLTARAEARHSSERRGNSLFLYITRTCSLLEAPPSLTSPTPQH